MPEPPHDGDERHDLAAAFSVEQEDVVAERVEPPLRRVERMREVARLDTRPGNHVRVLPNICIEIANERREGSSMSKGGKADFVDAAKKGDLGSWQQFTFLKWCCWWPPWSNNPLPVAVTVFLPKSLDNCECAEVIARLVSQQHDVNPPHFSEIFGWPCWWWDLRDNFWKLLPGGP